MSQTILSKPNSTLLLRLALVAIGLLLLAFFAFVSQSFFKDALRDFRPLVAAVYVSSLPIYVAIYQTFKLLGLIDRRQAFSSQAVGTLTKIKHCGLAVGAMYALSLPFFLRAAESDDAPGLIVIGMAISGGAFVVATFAALLARLLQSVVDMKTENDLTV